MSSKGKPSFTSLRVISEKAQKLLQRAQRTIGERDSRDGTKVELPMTPPGEEVTIRISVRSVVQATFAVLAIAAGVLLVYFLQDKIVLLLLAVFLAAVIEPGVVAMRKIGIPRGIGVLLQYAVALTLFVFLLVSLIPIVAKQLAEIARIVAATVDAFIDDPRVHLPLLPPDVNDQLTELAKQLRDQLSIEKFTDALQQFSENFGNAAQGSLRFIANVAGSVLNFVVSLIVVLVLAFFIQLEKEKIFAWLKGFLPLAYRRYLDSKSEVIHFKLGQWVRGQLLLGLSIGALVFIALLILGMEEYAVTLALLAAFTEFIPVIGPFIAAVPAVLIAFTQGGFLFGVVVAGVYYVVQWCENNLLVPLIMKRAVGLSPIAILFAMLVGLSFPTVIHPVLGIILSIPITTIIALFLEDWRELRTHVERSRD